jgi:hypothetical protein
MCYRILLLLTIFALAGCASFRTRWSLENAYLSPRAQRLPRAEIEELIRTVSYATGETVYQVGQFPHQPMDEMNVVTGYNDYGATIFEMRKTDGHWRIYKRGPVLIPLAGGFAGR